MRKKYILIVSFVVLVIVGWSVYDFLRPIEQKIDWVYDYDRALNEAKTEKKPLLIYFYTEWCGWCEKLERDTYSNDDVASLLNDNFICLRIDAEKQPNLVALYLVTGYPTVLFLSSEGEELGRIIGYRPPDVFMIVASSYILDH